ncbi:MAG: ATP-dependent Clp protease proteolytic subunit [Chloroflexi bacterium]|nr:ATP-dependent Clp protease proteolytic subunit [Chloroflexota bacterium]
MSISFLDLTWVLVIILILVPVVQRWMIENTRRNLIRRFEKKRGSRLITLIHRQEALSFLGLAFARFIDIEDSEQVLRAIRLTSTETPIDIVLHTPGGLVLAAEQIAHALIRHKAPVTVFIPHYAMSGGTLLALAADKIVMDPNAVLGPVDPQLGQYPASSIIHVTEIKAVNDTDDETLILADVARKAVDQVNHVVRTILTGNGMDAQRASELSDTLTCGQWTHDYPISFEEAQSIGLPVSSDLPEEITQLMELYPQGGGRRPSVQYIPVPYPRPERPSPAPARKQRQ